MASRKLLNILEEIREYIPEIIKRNLKENLKDVTKYSFELVLETLGVCP